MGSPMEDTRNLPIIQPAGYPVIVEEKNTDGTAKETQTASTSTGRDLQRALADLPAIDGDMEKDVREGLAHLIPWGDR